MNPEGLKWNEASEFADAAHDAQWWINHLLGEVARLKEFEVRWNELEAATKP